MANTVVEVIPDEERGSPLLPPVSLAPVATIRQSPSDDAHHSDLDPVAVGFGSLVFTVILLCGVVMYLARANWRLACDLGKSESNLAKLAARREATPKASEHAAAVCEAVNQAYYSELIGAIEFSMGKHGFRFGTDRAKEVVLPHEVLHAVTEDFSRSRGKYLQPFETDDDVSDRVMGDMRCGYSWQFVTTILVAQRNLGRYVEAVPVREGMPSEPGPDEIGMPAYLGSDLSRLAEIYSESDAEALVANSNIKVFRPE
ncbi:hypothetical protein [Cupriavidus pinatubonensis]|uniref:Transmembrane protein n=1 Tax=Cupriavidus pinatubonensis TaxID=248026 RepID=A0ABM8WRB1_9BURK|nr:hypothetical protein [Cupriavidus pinatubonensis]CAG9169913.1 hypothetical protein LMG23994_01726 [Cupriavidus pinatubonensis]